MKFFNTIALTLVASSLLITTVFAANVGVTTSNPANIYAQPNTDNFIQEVPQYTDLNIIGMDKNYYKILIDGSEAYVSTQDVEITQVDATVTDNDVNVREYPTTRAKSFAKYNQGDVVNVTGIVDDWYLVECNGDPGYIHSDYLTAKGIELLPDVVAPVPDITIQDEIVEYALSFTGTKYVYGGTDLNNGVDCSGFVYSVYKNFGYKLNRSSRDMYSNGTRVSRNELQPADLVFFDTNGGGGISHVGIYIGDDQFVHAASGKAMRVMVSSLNESTYNRQYVGATRIIE